MGSNSFDVVEHIKNLSARILPLLHWCVHSQGLSRWPNCVKNYTPIYNGVWAGYFQCFPRRDGSQIRFIDAVIRGEAEKPFLALVEALEKNNNLETVPNLTYRDSKGDVKTNELMPPYTDLDEFEFTRLDLIEPKQAIFPKDTPSHWSIPVCRGCSHNCVTCGGSKYSYKTYLGRNCPAFRSPSKIAGDIQKLSDQGIERVVLFQDPRMGGREYWSKLLTTLQNTEIKLNQLTMEIWGPADEEYIKELSKIRVPLMITIPGVLCRECVKSARQDVFERGAVQHVQVIRRIKIFHRHFQ